MPTQTQALQPPPPSWQPIIGASLYRWLVKLVKDLYTAVFPVIVFDGPNGSLIVSNVVFTDQSPLATSVSWSACTVSYKGVTYQIPAGNGAAINPYIVWQLSNPNVFQALGAITTLGPDDFLLGVNTTTGNPGVFGFFSKGFTITNRTGEHFLLYGTGFIHFNKEGNSTFAALRNFTDAVAAPAYGSIVASDGQGTPQVALQGNLGSVANPCGIYQQKPVTVAHLPTSPAVTGGERAVVSDATATTFASIVAGGGSNMVPVLFNGTNWIIG